MRRQMLLTIVLPATVAIGIEEAAIEGGVHSRPLQAVIALPLLLYLPGAALRQAASVRGHDGVGDRFLIPVGLSITVVIVGGVLLNFLAVGLRPQTWLAFLALVIGASFVVVLLRGDTDQLATVSLRRYGLRPYHAGVAAVGLATLGAAYLVALHGAHHQHEPGFTELWLAPSRSGDVYVIGTANYLHQQAAFTVDLKVRGQRTRRWDVSLAPQHSWSTELRLPARSSATATLIRTGSARVSRQVYLTTP
jgi:hypothetical protein